MIPHYQLPRNTLRWLFISQLAVLLPHGSRTPTWVIVLLFLCMGWRIQVFRGRWNFPKPAIKISLLLLSCIGLVMTFPSFFGLEALVSALFVGYALKLLEMYQKRDALVLLYLSFFLVMTAFLFEQGILLAGFQLVALILIFTALMGLYQERGHEFPRESIRCSAILILQALPLMALLFVMLPRLPSFWNIPLQKNTPKTGMSDSLSPGDFGRLVQSTKPVMRVHFNGPVPAVADMYWRGLVFTGFDGRRWGVEETPWHPPPYTPQAYQLEDSRKDFLRGIATYGLVEPLSAEERRFSYEVILEPTQTSWLYALANSIPDTSGIWLNRDQLLAVLGPVAQRFRYEAKSYPDLVLHQSLPEWQRSMNLALPEEFNPRARERAHQWRLESASESAYVNRLLDWFHRDFYYTLKPPTLGEHSVDEFLFDTKKGFCEHFASSFVFMLRAAGIPARVVVGYQGGEYNPLQNYYLVRQYDAHAWAEVWIQNPESGEGQWQRYDPTFAVAPQRILDGFRETFEASGELDLPLISLENYRDSSIVNFIRLQLDSLNYQWARWVLGYDAERQFELLSGWLGQHSLGRILFFCAGFILVFMASLYALLRWQERDRTPDPVLKAYRRLCRRLARRGILPDPAETPSDFLCRVSRLPDRPYRHLAAVGEGLYAYWYRQKELDPDRARVLCKMLRL